MWRTVTIHPRHRLTDEAVEVAVLPRSGSIRFRPGQFVVLEMELPDGIRRSAFSIVRRENKGIILGVKRSGPGGISDALCAQTAPLKASLAGPFGQFSLIEGPEHHVFITAGSGITPVRSLLDLLMEKRHVPTVIFANKNAESAMYGASFRALHDKGYIRLIEVFDRNIHRVIQAEHRPGAGYYVCGPPGLIDLALTSLGEQNVPDHLIQTEKYGLDMGANTQMPGSFVWTSRWKGNRVVELDTGMSMLQSALEHDIPIPHACEVGVCGACRARVVSGSVLCGKKLRGPGEEAYTCISQPHGDAPPVLREPAGSRRDIVSVSLIAAAILIGLWWVPPGLGLRAKGPMNTSHTSLSCEACHKPAEGTLRQQLGHNARVAFGLSDLDFAAVGHAPVDNGACLDCHDRPNDQHPVSRFMEARFAEQQVELGVHECNGCHGEHQGKRVANVGVGFCASCHSDLQVDFDPISPSHAVLIADAAWETCLSCHDFHGNHKRTVPEKLTAGIPTERLLDYLDGGDDPYGAEKHHIAPESPPSLSP